MEQIILIDDDADDHNNIHNPVNYAISNEMELVVNLYPLMGWGS